MSSTIYSFNRLCKSLWIAQNRCCFYCDKEIYYQQGTRDHVFPKSMGYTRSRNIVISCESCNIKKSNTFPSFEVIQKVIDLYDSIGEIFHPEFVCENNGPFITFKSGFRRIGIGKRKSKRFHRETL